MATGEGLMKKSHEKAEKGTLEKALSGGTLKRLLTKEAILGSGRWGRQQQ